MRKIFNSTVLLLVAALCMQPMAAQKEFSLKEVVQGRFRIGVAVNPWQLTPGNKEGEIIQRNFTSIVAENCMKCDNLHPQENRYNFTQADAFVDWGVSHDMFVVGHCLIWHSQLAPWFCRDSAGHDVSPAVLKERMREHITTIVTRYKGRVKGWDVVNEAIMEDGSYRRSPFYRILGEEFIPLAFRYAHEADPDAELYYNDYNTWFPGKRDAIVRLVKSLKAQGLRIDAVGMQTHIDLYSPTLQEYETAMLAYAAAGVKVMATEWDMSALPPAGSGANVSDHAAYQASLNPYPNGLPQSVSTTWNRRMGDFFALFIRHSDIVLRVTAWGLTDGESWKNGFPVRGRTDYPLLFDRNLQPKPFLLEKYE